MNKFTIGPHMRLQEWVAEEKGYFRDEDLDYEFLPSTGYSKFSVKSAADLPKDQISGAYQTIEAGRPCDISSACHWTVNMAAAAGHGRLWAEAYSVTPAGVMVSPDSNIRRVEDLANVPITVGYQSGSPTPRSNVWSRCSAGRRYGCTLAECYSSVWSCWLTVT